MNFGVQEERLRGLTMQYLFVSLKYALSIGLAMCLLSGNGHAAQAGEEGEFFIVGVVPQFSAKQIHAVWRPILDRLEKETGHRFKLQGSPNISRFEQEFQAGVFDLAYMNPYHLLKAEKAQGYVPLVRDVGRSLHGILVVKKDGDIKRVEDLEGRVVAFPAPNALGASLMLRAAFADEFNISVKPVHVKTHSSVYLNVMLGRAAAGGGVLKTLSRQKEGIRDGLKILYKSKGVPPHSISVHPRVSPAAREQLRSALLALGADQSGRDLLSGIPMKQVGRAEMADYQSLSALRLERFWVGD